IAPRTSPLLPDTRSEMALPLISRGEVLGAMTIQSTKPDAFAREDVTVLQVMADQLANAIENARLFQERERRITELGIVNEIGQALASALGVEELLQTVHQQVCRLFDADNFYIAIYDEDSDTWTSAFHLEQGRRQAPARYPVGTGLTGYIIRSRKAVLLSSAADSTAFGKEHGIEIIGEIARSWLGVPLLAADELVGVMAIQDYDHENLYSQPDLVLFATIAAQVAGALNNLRLLEEARQRAQEMEVINRFGGALSACQDLQAMLQVVYAGVRDLLIIDDLYLTLYDADTGKVTSVLRIVDGEAKRTGTSWNLGRGGLIDYLIHSRQPLLLPDRVVERVREMDIAAVPVQPGRAPASWLGVPMMLGDRVLGTLVVLHRTTPRAYGEHSSELLTAVANRAALALQSVRLLAETRDALAEVQSTHRSYLRRGWQEHLSQRSLLEEGTVVHERDGREDSPEVKVVRGFWRPEIDEVLSGGPPGVSEPGEKTQESEGLAVPISLRGQTIGVLGVESPADPQQWTDEDLALLEAVGEQLAQTLEAARLFADTERRAEQLATLHRVGLDITTALDLDGVLQALYEQIRRILPVDAFSVALYDDLSASIEFPLVRGRQGPFQLGPTEIREARRVVGHVIGTGRPLHLPDLAGRAETLTIQSYAPSAQNLRAYLGVPLVFRDKVFGVLSIQSEKPGAYSGEDVELLSTIATQASIAIQNARAYERLVGTAEQLREVDRLKTQFLA
ncbi:MAG: GAF domain-containing protein, partial [Anaerolineae bacterium]|nr:GAF domain-containing protein [Anaerolineae bacterium]